MVRLAQSVIDVQKRIANGGQKETKPATTGSAKRKKYRFKPGTVIKREIRKLQRTTNLLVPSAPFGRLVREVAASFATNGIRFEKKALAGLHIAAEDFITEQFKDADRNMRLITNGKRVTMNPSALRSTIAMKYGNMRI